MGMMRFLMMAGLIVGLLETSVRGDLIFGNDITGTNPSNDNPYIIGQRLAPGVTALGIGRGTGINANNANDRYNANSWDTTAFDPSAHFTFTIAPNAGFFIDFTNFVYSGQRSGAGPTSFAFRTSLDSFVANIGTPSAVGTAIDLSGPSFQGVASPIEFRLYGFGASSSVGTFSVNDFAFNGTVTAVPEPSSLTLVAIGGIGGAIGYLRRRSLAKASAV